MRRIAGEHRVVGHEQDGPVPQLLGPGGWCPAEPLRADFRGSVRRNDLAPVQVGHRAGLDQVEAQVAVVLLARDPAALFAPEPLDVHWCQIDLLRKPAR